MLTASQFDQLSTPIVDLYETFATSVVEDIARRLSKLSFASAAWQMQRLTESGQVYEAVLKRLAELTGQSEATLRQTFQSAGVQAMRFDNVLYKAAGLNPLPLNLSPQMLNVLLSGLNKTGNVMRNLTLTTANAAQTAFLDAADLAYMQVVHGAMSYGQAIRQAVKQVARQSLVVTYPTGHKDQLDVAMRRAVLTGVAATTGNLQLQQARDLGVDLVQTSAHIGARPTHEVWQGKVFSLSGAGKYPDFITETGYGTVTGLCGINCRHSFYPFFEGLSEEAYKAATLQEYADKTVEYNGKTLSVYEATQRQRAVEREIRKVKREAAGLAAAGQDNTAELSRVRSLQAKMRDFVNQTGLDRQNVREGGRVAKSVVVPEMPKPSINILFNDKHPEAFFKAFGYGKADSAAQDAMVKAVNELDLSIKSMWRDGDAKITLATAPGYAGAHFASGWIVVGDSWSPEGKADIFQHEFIHHILWQPDIRRNLLQYEPVKLFQHAAASNGGKLGSLAEDLTMVLSEFSGDRTEWIKRVSDADSLGEELAIRKINSAIEFLRKIGYWNEP